MLPPRAEMEKLEDDILKQVRRDVHLWAANLSTACHAASRFGGNSSSEHSALDDLITQREHFSVINADA